MLLRNGFSFLSILICASLFLPVLSDAESGFSQGCYSACPRKIWTLENSSREQIDKEWIQCLKQCHQINSWKFIIIVCSIVVIFSIACIVIYVCCGEKIRLKYTFHVEKKKRIPINPQDQSKIKIFEDALNKFKQIMTDHLNEFYIEFQNDNGHKKKFFIEEAIFQQRKHSVLQNMFSIILYNKKQQSENVTLNLTEFQEQSQNQMKNNSNTIKNQENQYSQLIGAISYTTTGVNLWWIKIDEKPQNKNKCCKIFSRKNKKYFAVYEKDPFAPEGSFIGNVVLEDSSKQADERYAMYVLKRKQPRDMALFQQRVIET